MSTPTNHFKLGLFVLVGFAAAVATLVLIGAQSMKTETVSYHTFFNESVQGLEIGSPVKYRGVTIGHVSQIEIAPDRRHVDVLNELDVADIKRLGLASVDTTSKKKLRFLVPPDLRAQLGSQGITGVKFVQIDFFDPKTNPPPEIPFPIPEDSIPVATSMMKNLEDTVTKAVDQVPEIAQSILRVVNKIDSILGDIQSERVPARAAVTLANADQALVSLNGFIHHADQSHLPDRVGKAIDNLDRTVGNLNQVIETMGGEKGLLASAQRATDAFGDVGKSAHGTTRELEDTLREVREAAESIRTLADAIEREPDMLLKGRQRGKTR